MSTQWVRKEEMGAMLALRDTYNATCGDNGFPRLMVLVALRVEPEWVRGSTTDYTRWRKANY